MVLVPLQLFFSENQPFIRQKTILVELNSFEMLFPFAYSIDALLRLCLRKMSKSPDHVITCQFPLID